MASENETFDEVLRCMQNDIVHFVGKPVKHSRDLLQEYHGRFKAAHRREVAELRECLEQAYGDKIGTYTMKGNEVERWRKALREKGGSK